MAAINVFVRSQGNVTLKDFLASGGEGDVYSRSGFAYKIYHKPSRALPIAKIQELSVLDKDQVLRPLEPIFKSKGNELIGYMMLEAPSMVPLAKYFNKGFKQKNNVTPDDTLRLIQHFQNLVQYVHEKKILIVDLNEMNFGLNDKLDLIYCMDVDSYQTPSFPATALMDSVRDPLCSGNRFTELSDWYSFAIVSFNMFIGVHPFKGGHPKFDHLKKVEAMFQRMKQNVSALNKDARLPGVALPLDVIPPVYRDWYTAVLEEGKRLIPPFDLNAKAGSIITKTISLSGNLVIIELITSFESNIVHYFSINGIKAVMTSESIHKGKESLRSNKVGSNRTVAITPKRGYVLEASVQSQTLVLRDVVTGKEIPTTVAAEAIMSYQGRIYAKNNDKMFEVEIVESTVAPQAIGRHIGNVLPKASRLYDGCVIQNLLGAQHAMIFDAPKTNFQFHLPELDGIRIIDARYESGILVVMGHDGSQYNKYIVRVLNGNYDVRVDNNPDNTDINFTVLDNGICVMIVSDGVLEIFSNKPGSNNKKEVKDPTINTDMKLFHDGVKVLFGQNNELYSMTMKK